MKALKTLLALGVAMGVSTTTFAETANPLAGLKETAKTAVTEQVTSAKSSATSALSNVKDSAKNAVKTAKESAVDSVKNAKTSAKEMASNAKSSVTEKAQTARDTLNSAKTTATEKTQAVKEKAISAKNSVKENVAKAKEAAATKVAKNAKVNINTADAKTLQTLGGIGEAKAKAIIDYRNKAGKIKDLAELSKVSGIGSATIEKIAPFLTF